MSDSVVKHEGPGLVRRPVPRLLDRSILYTLTRTWLDVVANGGSLFSPQSAV
ncbi:hypothetical protein GCM10009610_22110 [Pseudonocardia xinjiangensis]